MGTFNPGSSSNSPSNAGVRPPFVPQQQQPQPPQHVQQHVQQLKRPVAILWDIENCPVPNEVNAEDIAGNVRMALSVHPAYRGSVTMFSAYGDFNHFPRKVREGCQRTGINLIDVPNSKKDASDKAILVDMFLFALDNRPPCTILLITGDVDFAPALHKLGQRGYTVVLAIPAGFVSASLCSAGRDVWDWASVARGNGIVPATKTFQPRENIPSLRENRPPMLFSDESGDESLRSFGGGPVGFATQSSGEWFPTDSFSANIGQGYPSPSQTQGYWSQVNPVSFGRPPFPTSSVSVPPAEAGEDSVSPRSNTSFVQPGDITGLKRQLVRLLGQHGGKMELLKVPPEYCKMYGRPLYLQEYGSGKLVHLIDRMRDTVCIKGEGSERKVHLTKAGSRRYRKSSKKDLTEDTEGDEQEGKDAPKEESKSVVDEEVVVYVSKMDLSHESDSASPESDHQEEADEVIEIQEVRGEEYSQDILEEYAGNVPGEYSEDVPPEYALEVRREVVRQELQELLVSHACHIFVSDFLMLYRQRYGKEPDYEAFGVEGLEGLFEKVKDVAVLKQGSGGKSVLVANVGFLPRVGSSSSSTTPQS